MAFKVDEHFSLTGSLKTDAAVERPITQQVISEIGSQSSEEAVLIRLLLGTVNILHGDTQKKWRQHKNYSVLGAPKIGITTDKGLKKLLNNVDIDDERLNNYLRHSLKQRKYYREILLEMVHHFHRNMKDECCIAFLHLYRFMERISYAFPLIYSVSTEDYKGTYDSLKEFFGEGGKGELGFFSKFIETAIDPSLLDSTSIFKFTLSSENENDAAVTIIRKFIQEENIISAADGEIVIRNRCLISLIINLRNRFFHFSSGQTNNITLIDLPDPDKFFQEVNSICLGWLSVIYFAVLRKKVEIHVANS